MCALHFPKGFIALNNKTIFTGEEVFLFGLHRLSRPTRLEELANDVFGRDYTQLSRAFHWFLSHLWGHFSFLLLDNLDYWSTTFSDCANSIYKRLLANGMSPLAMDSEHNYFAVAGFIDGTIQPCVRPGGGPVGKGGKNANRHDSLIQRAFYTGWKKLHGLKWQGVTLPNGIIADFWGPISARHNDIYILRVSQIHQRWKNAQVGNSAQFKLFGDGIYPIMSHLQSRNTDRQPMRQSAHENSHMAKTRTCVEWSFGKIVSLWVFIDYKRNLQLLKLRKDLGKIVGISVLLTNCHTCLYGSQTSLYFEMLPPLLEDYLQCPT